MNSVNRSYLLLVFPVHDRGNFVTGDEIFEHLNIDVILGVFFVLETSDHLKINGELFG
jgi:hypothetical protein